MKNRIAGFVGAGLLALGVFMPVMSAPIIGNVSLMGAGSNPVAYALLALAGLVAWLVAKDRDTDLVWPGGASALTLAYLFGRLQIQLASLKASMAEQMADNPFAGLAKSAMGTVQIQWGWLVLAAGAGTLIYLAVQARRSSGLSLWAISGGRLIAIASLVALLVAPALDAWGAITAPPSKAPAVADVEAPGATAAPVVRGKDPAETAYIRDHLKLYDLEAKYHSSYTDNHVPGVDFKIKNEGDRTLNRVTVNVVFYDENDKPIAEEEYNPVLVTEYSFGDNTPLKPNYIWQQERGRFYSADKVPSEWKAGKVTASITSIEFAPAQ